MIVTDANKRFTVLQKKLELNKKQLILDKMEVRLQKWLGGVPGAWASGGHKEVASNVSC